MSADLLVVIPTRGRRELLTRCITTFMSTTDDADLLVVKDDDDDSYDGLIIDPPARMISIPQLNLAAKQNRVVLEEAPHYRAIFVVGDDHTFDTPHWDTIMMTQLEEMGGTGMVYPDDKRRSDIGEILLVSTDIILALGWLCLPALGHYWADNVVNDIGRHAQCLRFCPAVVITHHHYSVDSTTPYDSTYQYGESFGADDAQAYMTWRHDRMDADIAVVRKLLKRQKTTSKGSQ